MDTEAFAAHFAADCAASGSAVEMLDAEGCIVDDGPRFRLTPRGRKHADVVGGLFFRRWVSPWWPPTSTTHEPARSVLRTRLEWCNYACSYCPWNATLTRVDADVFRRRRGLTRIIDRVAELPRPVEFFITPAGISGIALLGARRPAGRCRCHR
ncbi:MAG: hypothetical protein U0736_07425 [Gemmataceae bacterium]